jgi:hypothetical protein
VRLERALAPAFAKVDRFALGAALGTVTAAVLFFASIFLVLKGGPHVGKNLKLLGQYLPGYEASPRGALLGIPYGLVVGFIVGWTLAVVRNAAALFSLAVIRRRAELRVLRRVLDYL